MARTDPELAADIAATSLAGAEVIRSLLREALADRAIDEEALHREALLLFALVESFSFSSALFSAPLHGTDVRAVVTATLHRLRDAYPPSEAVEGAARDPEADEQSRAYSWWRGFEVVERSALVRVWSAALVQMKGWGAVVPAVDERANLGVEVRQ